MKNGYGSPYLKVFTSLGEVTDRVTDFAYKFSQKGDDVCQIRIESDNQNLPDLPIYQEGVEFSVIWGYIGESLKQRRLVILRNVKVGYVEDGISLDLLLTDKPSLIKTNSSKRVYNKKSVKDINDDIANRNGLISQYVWESLQSNLTLAASSTLPTATTSPNPDIRIYETLPQANRSDYETLKEAADNDPTGPYEIVGRDNILSVQKPNFNQEPIRSYIWKGGDGELLQFIPESKEYFAGSGSIGITSTTVNPKTKTFEESTVTEGNNGIETKLNDQISSPNHNDEDDGPGFLTGVAEFFSDAIDDITNAADHLFSNEASEPIKKKTPIRNDPSIKGKTLNTSDTIKDGDKNYNPVKDSGFETLKKDVFAGRVFRYGIYNTESPSYVGQSGFNTAQVATTATITKKPYIPTFLTGQHSPSIEDNHKDASGKAASVQNKKSLEKNPATAKVVGNVILESGKVITISNISKKFSGNYYVQEALHRLKPGDMFYVEMEFVRNAVGRVSKQPRNTVDISSKYSKLGNNLKANKVKGKIYNTSHKRNISELDIRLPRKRK